MEAFNDTLPYFALLNYMDEEANDTGDYTEVNKCTLEIQSSVDKCVSIIKQEYGDDLVNQNGIANHFYGELHYGLIKKYTPWDEDKPLVDEAIQQCIAEIGEIETKYPGAGIGDTATDECIAHYFGEQVGVKVRTYGDIYGDDDDDFDDGPLLG